ncbi:MAG TPA: ABC transporter ATP-binding protein [Dehalococcoidales bacterium]|nr:ABC transporter ATP-binding protein [Dehalococcoidales bacterium]
MEDIISLEHVNKELNHRQILKDVTLSVKSGDIFGYLGPNGAGKTTTIRIILGLMAANSGKVSVLGRDVQMDKTRQKVGFVLETDGLYENMNALENLVYYAKLYDVAQPAGKAEEALKLVGLADRAADKVGTYSKGMRQRLALARAMVPDPDLLVLDEPTAGVDPTGQIEIRQLMLDMIHKRGKTILLSSHNLDEVQRICNRIALIHKGQIRLYGELEKLQREMGQGGVEIETMEPIPSNVVAEISRLPGISVREQHERTLVLAAGAGLDVSSIVALLAARGVKVEQFKKQEASLEEMYTTIVKEAEQK